MSSARTASIPRVPSGGKAKAIDTRTQAFPYGAPVPQQPAAAEVAAPRPSVSGASGVGGATSVKAGTGNSAVGTSMVKNRLDPSKCANPFQTDTRKCKTQFSQSYVARAIPCRLQSTASKHYLQWDEYAKTGFSPDLLLVCADGLTEDQHPYTLMAPMMMEELVARSEGNAQLFAPVMDTLAAHLRKALMNDASFEKGVRALKVIVGATDAMILPYLTKIVPCLAKGMRDKAHRDEVLSVLGLIEHQCGPEARKVIKLKIPTY
jgi:hypothetical protein